MDILKIMEFLPHRYPFLLVDRILEVGEDRVRGLKNVTINEPFFQGHFPGEPVMPGVLILEAMGQVAAYLVSRHPGLEGMTAFLTSVEDAKFRRPVRPGDQLITEARMIKMRGRMGKVSVVSSVEGDMVSQAVLGFALSRGLTRGDD